MPPEKNYLISKYLKIICTLIILCVFGGSVTAHSKLETLQWLQGYSPDYCQVSFRNKFDFQFTHQYSFLDDAFMELTSGDFIISTKVYYKDIVYMEDLTALEEQEYKAYSPPMTAIKIPVHKQYRLVDRPKGKVEQLIEGDGFYLYYETGKPKAREHLLKVIEHLMKQVKLTIPDKSN